ncbi:MAG: 30S ribosomal protein S16 [Phycisphaerae bacterium]|jgi:small subunit ribosomal protein S16|nr:30S ribosomal protein S16 [Phycisphaerae bacterium]MCZ2399108.1 30S ribosomal protein S16 [Phycisphaerae bacterium]NUQ50141.1 30S ribosomal protein S16 [Phycisphaerae bacterium]
MVKLRLKRMGRTHRAYYRLSAMDERNPRDGRVLEDLGVYDPQNKDRQQQLVLNADRISHWLRVGAMPTDTVRQLLKRHGIGKK